MKSKIAIVVSSPMTVKAFLQEHIRMLGQEYEVTVIANMLDRSELDCLGENIRLHPVTIERKISLWRDLKAFIILWSFFRREQFDVVHSITPKAGLLAMSSAFFAGIKHRIHTFTGQVWATKIGFKRSFFKFMDRILSLFTNHALVDSKSQRQFLLDEKVLKADNAVVLANGSISGVDVERFFPNHEAGKKIRMELKIPEEDIVFLFLGRLNPDKGVSDLAAAFATIIKGRAVSLLVVGPDETEMKEQMREVAGRAANKMFFVDYTHRAQDYMNAADVFCLPSYREGFGSVIIEAAAVGIPAIGSNIYGVSDAIINETTGLLHQVKDINDIAAKMIQLADDTQQRENMGHTAQERACKDFTMAKLSSALLDEYMKVLRH